MAESAEFMADIAKKGESVFSQTIAPAVQDRNPRDYVAIDVDSGDYEIASDSLVATRALRLRHPAARVWGRFVGSPISVRFGGLR